MPKRKTAGAESLCRERHKNVTQQCGRLEEELGAHTEKLHGVDIKFAELSGDVKHIKDRIDNGLSQTLNEVKDKVDGFVPLVRESSEWAGRFKQAIYFVAVIGFGGGVVSLLFRFVQVVAARWMP